MRQKLANCAVDLLKNESAQIRLEAVLEANAIVKAVPQELHSVVDGLVDLFKDRSEESRELRERAFEAAVNLAHEFPEVAQRLASCVADAIKDQDPKVSFLALEHAFEMSKASPETGKLLADSLMRIVRDKAFDAYCVEARRGIRRTEPVKFDRTITGSLRCRLVGTPPTVHCRVVEHVLQFAKIWPEVAWSLTDCMTALMFDESWRVRFSVIAQAAEVASLTPELSQSLVAVALDLMNIENRDVRESAASQALALARVAPDLSHRMAVYVLDVMKDKEEHDDVRRSAILQSAELAKMAPDLSHRMAGCVLDFMEDKDVRCHVRKSAILQLAELAKMAPDLSHRMADSLADFVKIEHRSWAPYRIKYQWTIKDACKVAKQLPAAFQIMEKRFIEYVKEDDSEVHGPTIVPVLEFTKAFQKLLRCLIDCTVVDPYHDFGVSEEEAGWFLSVFEVLSEDHLSEISQSLMTTVKFETDRSSHGRMKILLSIPARILINLALTGMSEAVEFCAFRFLIVNIATFRKDVSGSTMTIEIHEASNITTVTSSIENVSSFVENVNAHLFDMFCETEWETGASLEYINVFRRPEI